MTGAGAGGTTVAVTTLNDGSAAAQSITYAGLDPLANSGSATDIVFNLTAGADQAVLEDNGAAADNTSRLRSNNGTFETTVFGHPASSLTLNAGAGDSVAVDFLDSLGTADLTIGSLTSAAVRPDSINVNNVVTSGTVNLAATGSIGELVFDVAPDIVANAAALLAGGNIAFLRLQVSTVAAANTGSGVTQINNTGDLVVGTVSGIAGITALGGMDLTSTGNITINNDVRSSTAFVRLEAAGLGSAITNNAAVSTAGLDIELKSERMLLAAGTISAVAGSVGLSGLGGAAINLGSQTDVAAGTVELSDSELDTITTPFLGIGGPGDREHHGQQPDHRQRPLRRALADRRWHFRWWHDHRRHRGRAGRPHCPRSLPVCRQRHRRL